MQMGTRRNYDHARNMGTNKEMEPARQKQEYDPTQPNNKITHLMLKYKKNKT